ncbi:hypothetical protein NDU88_004046 [Pleurodeles waltl]|uniref:Uncharacterized protein n=1 Tax=Pleurodeles waltl TaxID=8319 RepID=A0AAV7M773_PLEWA|nr:hypothetical protein NDU88_004046 [Pleurodeles waltl]
MDTPLDHMIKTFPSDKKKLLKYCKQRHKGTEGHAQPWPKEGTFDNDIAEHTLTYIRSTYKKKKRQKREAILSLWRVFCHEKPKVKSTVLEEVVAQTQTESPGESLGEPPPYGLYPILPAAGYQVPVRVEHKKERLEAQGAEATPSPVPSAPRANPEQSGRDRLVSELQHMVRQAEQSRSLAPLWGQWTTGHVILRLGDTSADTLREAAEEWIEEEEEWEGVVETPQYEEPRDGSQVVTGAEDDEDWDNGFNRSAHEQGVNRSLNNFRPRPTQELIMTARDGADTKRWSILKTRGNTLADWAAKEAAKTSPNYSEQDEHTLGMMTSRQQDAIELPPPNTETARLHLRKLQEQALPHERELLEQRGCIQSPTDFIYRQESTGKPVMPQVLLYPALEQLHFPAHTAKEYVLATLQTVQYANNTALGPNQK